MEKRIKLELSEMEVNLILGMMNNTLDIVSVDLDDPEKSDYASLVISLIKRMLHEIKDNIDNDSME